MAVFEEQEYNQPFSLRIWAKLFPFFKPYKKYFLITMGLNIFLAAVDIHYRSADSQCVFFRTCGHHH